MSWAGLANNQTVSFNNLQDAVNNGNFTALTTIPVSTEQITKSDASTYVNCDTSFASFAAKSSNQLVVKSNLVTTTTTSTTTTSSTTTTTTSPLKYVTFYGVMGAQSNSQETLYYSTDNSTWNPIAQAFTDTCGIIEVISVNSGDTLYLSVGDPSSTVYFYNATNNSTCPANSANFCGLGNPYNILITADTDIAVTQYVAGGDILAC